MKQRNIECKHYKGSGYHYSFIGGTLWLCKKCERKLRAQILAQDKLEKELDKNSFYRRLKRMAKAKKKPRLSKKTIKEIEAARKRIKQGRFYTEEEMK
ncbi:MAG: hypothetical protein KJ767_00760 [Nanoarchaeota archaeon]|nr:hypothetical protein [Nanoarchaeota archaeon]